MKFKEYEKKYEDYPTIEYEDRGKKRIKCELEKVSTRIGWDVDQYLKVFKDEMWRIEGETFIRAIRLIWLSDQFGYNKDFRPRINTSRGYPGVYFASALGSFVRYYVGFDNRLFLQSLPFLIIRSYLLDWYPNIREENPFEVEIKYPYDYMNMECAGLVYRMPERMELLKIGEERKMTFPNFLNYVVNYIFCYNEEHGDTYYLYTRAIGINKIFMHVRLVKKYESIKTDSICSTE